MILFALYVLSVLFSGPVILIDYLLDIRKGKDSFTFSEFTFLIFVSFVPFFNLGITLSTIFHKLIRLINKVFSIDKIEQLITDLIKGDKNV